MKTFFLWSMVFLLFETTSSAVASPARVGVAEVEITPGLGQKLAGYEVERHAEAIHDPLFAKVLLLRAENASLVIVTTDLYSLHLSALSNRISREFNITCTILSSSRNRSAPALDPDNSQTPWGKEVQEKIVKAVERANKTLFTAEITWVRGSLVAGQNVRILEDDGTVHERWMNPDEGGSAPFDPTVTVIRVNEEGSGKLKALLVHYSCQPAVLGPDSRLISADFPGALARHVQTELGREVVCLFAAGSGAQIYPFRSSLSGPEAFAEVEKLGQRIGREVVRLARLSSLPDADYDIKVHQGEYSYGYGQGGDHFIIGISTVLINRALAFVAVPAEMFVEFQLSLSARSPVPSTLLIGNAYSFGRPWNGRIPTIAASAEGGFGTNDATDAVIGAGEAIVDHALIQLYRFLGKLDDLPRGRLVVGIPDLTSP